MDAIADSVFTDIGASDAPTDDPSLLTVVLDVTPQSWYKIRNQITIHEVAKSLLVFLNAHLSLNNSNQVAFVASTPQGSKFLYPNPEKDYDEVRSRMNRKDGDDTNMDKSEATPSLVGVGMYRQFRIVDEAVLEKLNEVFTDMSNNVDETRSNSTLSGALSLALTYTNRMLNLDLSISTTTASAINTTTNVSANKTNSSGTTSNSTSGTNTTSITSMRSRILIVSSNDDDDIKYIPTMNTTFAAQKMKVPIDVAKLGEKDSSYLQQASDATNGVYLNIKNPEGLIQTLCTAFFIEPSIRPLIILPTNSNVNYRASCFITGKSVNLGFVCSVCLCIMSIIPNDGACPTCSSKFNEKTLAQLRRGVVIPTKKKRKLELNGDGLSENGQSEKSTSDI